MRIRTELLTSPGGGVSIPHTPNPTAVKKMIKKMTGFPPFCFSIVMRCIVFCIYELAVAVRTADRNRNSVLLNHIGYPFIGDLITGPGGLKYVGSVGSRDFRKVILFTVTISKMCIIPEEMKSVTILYIQILI